ncbi:glycosyltransferase family 1 [Fusarium austroafricanum]|uniref:Glycosyltransferase family 1 n=1 Tax=Fusarium austroafricanum TaxID=2364996 RepID=A0A8H4KEM2_9HYPO|nr:glycosyltransferase family 1 [Fusarium austroafricanum]
MLRRGIIVGAVLVALFSFWYTNRPSKPLSPLSFGRKNVVLFLTTAANGFTNVHLATSHVLSSTYLELDIHYASFTKLKPDVERISSVKNPIKWHELPPPDILQATEREYGGIDGLAAPPGLKGIEKLMSDVQIMLSPWSAEEHWHLYKAMTELILQVDPAVVVLDIGFRPAIEAVRDSKYMHIMISANTLIDSFPHKQPWGAMFWKYPAVGSGHPFPVPWRLTLTNIYLQLRMIHDVLVAPGTKAKRAYLQSKGINKPIDLVGKYRPDVPWLSSSLPEASLPMVVPEGAKYAGPIVLETEPLADQDADMAVWLKRAPTILINLGSVVRYDESQAQSMATALLSILETTNHQILWKMKKRGDFDDSFLIPVKEYVANERLRLEKWIKAHPTALLATGDIKLSVHHGGANCYHEAIFYGVPQVILPKWFDTYNYAATAEYVGVGIWPNKATAPNWTAEELSSAFIKVISNETMREAAQRLGQVARQYDGRHMAARAVAAMAAKGHE